MKLIEGGSLSNQVARLVNEPKAAAALLATVAQAVHHAHQRGILHRDLKPSNILIDNGGQPLVTDFGLAKRVAGDARLTQSGAIVGSPSYMAPGQARAERGLTTAVDIYGLGAVLYELLTGQPPCRAATPLETVLQLLEREPQRPRSLAPRVDVDLETICLKCLEREPEKRYASAAELSADLRRFVEGRPILARPVGRVERAVKWVRRNRAPAGMGGIVATLLIGAAVISAAFRFEEKEQARQAQENQADAIDKEKQLAQANEGPASLARRPRDSNSSRLASPARAAGLGVAGSRCGMGCRVGPGKGSKWHDERAVCRGGNAGAGNDPKAAESRRAGSAFGGRLRRGAAQHDRDDVVGLPR